MTWPRVRIVFAVIGMLSVAKFIGVQFLEGVDWVFGMLEEGKEMIP